MHPALSTRSAQAALDQYLRRATRGLAPECAEEVRDELEEHALGLVDRYVLLGHSPQEALRLALRDLGSPWQVSAALNGVHNMPKLLTFAGIAALALSAGLYALAGGGRAVTVEVPALSQSPLSTRELCVPASETLEKDVVILRRQGGKICYAPKEKALYQGSYVGLNDVQKAYAAAGLKAEFTPDGALRITFPDGQWRVLMPRFTANGQGYVPAEMLIVNTLRPSLTPKLELSGYDNPLLSFGSLNLRLGTGAQPIAGMDFYRQIMPSLLGTLTSHDLSQGWSADYVGVNRRFAGAATQPRVTVNTGLQAGEVVMLVTKKDAETYFADLAPVGPDGSATLYRFPEHDRLSFVKALDALTPTPTDGKTPALLVKVTGVDLRDLKSGIFLPKP